ncbi:unnamed protein product, partial [marine sediment metagenome]
FICPETGIWSLETAKRKHRYDIMLAAQIATMFWAPKRAADVGCGRGHYCAIFKGCGWPIVDGYEGTPNITSLGVYDNIMILDLSKRHWVAIEYPFVLCLEIGEHIPKKHEQIFIDNVADFASKDLVLSWGVPGQGGTGHFNEQPNDYVIGEFEKRGLKYDGDRSKVLRDVATRKWFKNTLLVFHRQ